MEYRQVFTDSRTEENYIFRVSVYVAENDYCFPQLIKTEEGNTYADSLDIEWYPIKPCYQSGAKAIRKAIEWLDEYDFSARKAGEDTNTWVSPYITEEMEG